MTSIGIRKKFARVFTCWPSRVGAAAIVAVTVGWGAGVLSAAEGPPGQTVAAVQ
jgi:hypothetical protein